MIRLTPTQLEHYKSIEWLVSSPRCQGKSYLLAVCFLKRAIRELGTYIKVFDHYHSYESNKRLLTTIGRIFSEQGMDKNYKFYMSPSAGTFKVDIKTPEEI